MEVVAASYGGQHQRLAEELANRYPSRGNDNDREYCSQSSSQALLGVGKKPYAKCSRVRIITRMRIYLPTNIIVAASYDGQHPRLAEDLAEENSSNERRDHSVSRRICNGPHVLLRW